MSVVVASVFACPGTGWSPRPPSRRCCAATARRPGTGGSGPAKDQLTATPITSRSPEVKPDAEVSQNPAIAPPIPAAARTPSGAQVQSSGLGLTGSRRNVQSGGGFGGGTGPAPPHGSPADNEGGRTVPKYMGAELAGAGWGAAGSPRGTPPAPAGSTRTRAGARVGGLPRIPEADGDQVTQRAQTSALCGWCGGAYAKDDPVAARAPAGVALRLIRCCVILS